MFGWLLAHHPDAVTVPPGGNGSGLLAGYPDDLVTTGEARHGLNRVAPQSSELRHARSAWDVAGSGLVLARATGPRMPGLLASKPAGRPA